MSVKNNSFARVNQISIYLANQEKTLAEMEKNLAEQKAVQFQLRNELDNLIIDLVKEKVVTKNVIVEETEVTKTTTTTVNDDNSDPDDLSPYLIYAPTTVTSTTEQTSVR